MVIIAKKALLLHETLVYDWNSCIQIPVLSPQVLSKI